MFFSTECLLNKTNFPKITVNVWGKKANLMSNNSRKLSSEVSMNEKRKIKLKVQFLVSQQIDILQI